ncbi:hypothetical protein BIY29_07315 [Brenneria alni]|uniref:Type III secretion protein n=1 Tax=Brenneria alni TaxID=71656 RepID=A0A421DQ32_9GAMM|nr:type III secretion system HrpP C-terminal domain-containing protein [Brenneria alni]RLM25313.1 hypothetical protein BIY29_07315 [Brenneria alni]
MTNPTIPFQKPANTSVTKSVNASVTAPAYSGKGPLRGEKDQHSFWLPFSDFNSFEQAILAEETAPVLSAPLHFDQPYLSDTDATPEKVTSSQWLHLQHELVESVNNIGSPPYSFSLQLPQLGDIDITMAALAPQGWDISLRFSRETYKLLRPRRESCRRSLSDALGCPVRLSFASREVC